MFLETLLIEVSEKKVEKFVIILYKLIHLWNVWTDEYANRIVIVTLYLFVCEMLDLYKLMNIGIILVLFVLFMPPCQIYKIQPWMPDPVKQTNKKNKQTNCFVW